MSLGSTNKRCEMHNLDLPCESCLLANKKEIDKVLKQKEIDYIESLKPKSGEYWFVQFPNEIELHKVLISEFTNRTVEFQNREFTKRFLIESIKFIEKVK